MAKLINGEVLEFVNEEPYSENWFNQWEHFLCKSLPSKESTVRHLMTLARLGHQRDWEAKNIAKKELQKLLRSLAKQIKINAASPSTEETETK